MSDSVKHKLLTDPTADGDDGSGSGSGTAAGEKKKRSIHAWQNHVTPLALYIAVCVADVAAAVVLYEAVHKWDGQWSSVFEFANFTSFTDDTVDVFWTCVIRILAVTLLGRSAVSAGTPDFNNPPPSLLRALSVNKQQSALKEAHLKEKEKEKEKEEKGQSNGKSLNDTGAAGTVATLPDDKRQALLSSDAKANGDTKEPLLPAANGTSDVKQSNGHAHGHAHGGGHAHGHGHGDSDTRSASGSTVTSSAGAAAGGARQLTESDKYVITQNALSAARIRVAVLFMVTTVSQVFTGLKMVSYSFGDFSDHSVRAQAVLMGLSVIFINLEWMWIREIIDKMTREQGYLFATLHPHYLYYQNASAGHWCDLCRSRLVGGESYRCMICDFDLCVACFKKKNKSRGEGLLRGDKGIKDEREVNSTDYLLRALALAKPHTTMIVVACICLLATSASALLLPNYQGSILDDVINADRSKFASDVKFFIAMSVATGFFGSIRSLCFSVVGAKMANDVRVRLFKAVIIQDIAFFDGISTGELTSRLSQDANAMVQPCQTVLNTFLSNFLLFVGGLIMCFVTSWRLSVLAITSIGPIIQITQAYAKWSRQINKEIWAALGDASSVATQAISNIRTVRAFGCEDNETKNYLDAAENALNKGIKDAVASAGTYALTNYFDLGCTVLLLWYGGRLAMDDEGLTVGKLITFQLYWGMINNAYQALMGILTQFTRAAGAATRVLSLMDSLPDIDPDAGVKVAKVTGDINVTAVDYTYQMRPDNKVLDGISLDIKAGQVVALVGKSGGGKSTLVHLLMRFYDPTKGKITLDGVDLTTLNLKSVHRHMGLVAQDTQLFAGTIEENIAYGMESYTQDDLTNAAKRANAHDFIMAFEEDYKTRVGERGVRLSGGQKQRIAIARAMLRKPQLLFLDEATSSLDTESEALVQMAIDRLMAQQKCTVVLVAHRLSTVINADVIAVIDRGRIIESGNHNTLLAKNGVYAKLVARQIARKNNTIEQSDEPMNAKKLAAIDTIDNLLTS